MKYIWEESDIKGGRLITRYNEKPEVTSIICQKPKCGRDTPEKSGVGYSLMCLHNGYINYSFMSAKALSDVLNSDKYIPMMK